MGDSVFIMKSGQRGSIAGVDDALSCHHAIILSVAFERESWPGFDENICKGGCECGHDSPTSTGCVDIDCERKYSPMHPTKIKLVRPMSTHDHSCSAYPISFRAGMQACRHRRRIVVI